MSLLIIHLYNWQIILPHLNFIRHEYRGLVNLAEEPAKEFALSVLRVGITQAVDGVIYRQ